MKNHAQKLVAFLMALLMAFEMAPVAVLAETLAAAPAAQEQSQGEVSGELPEEPLAVDNSDAQQLFDKQLTQPTEEPKPTEEPEILLSAELKQEQLVVRPVEPETLEQLISQIEGQPAPALLSMETKGIKKQAAAGPMRLAAAPVEQASGNDSASYTGYAAFDITPAEGQPQAQESTVTVDLDRTPVDLLAGSDLEQDRDYTIDAVRYTLYHFHTGEDGETRMETIALTDDNVVRQDNLLTGFTFITGDFSAFVLQYTVDFTYVDEQGEEHAISFPGRGSYPVAGILADLGITYETIENIALELSETVDEKDVDDQSRNALYLEGDTLYSYAAFNDVYTLTVVANGKTYVITVTDAETVTIEFYEIDDTTSATANMSGFDYLAVNIGYPNVVEVKPFDVNGSTATVSYTQDGTTGLALVKTNDTVYLNNNWWSLGSSDKIDIQDSFSLGAFNVTKQSDGTYKAVKQLTYTVNIVFPDNNGNLGEGYYVILVDEAENNNNTNIPYFYNSGKLTLNGDWSDSVINFSYQNGNPADHAYSANDTVVPHLYYSQHGLNTETNNNTLVIKNGEEITAGSVVNGFVLTVTSSTDSVTYTLRKPQPYKYSIVESSNTSIDFDNAYENNWYLLSTLEKADGSGTYYYATPVTLEGQSAIPGSGTNEISTFYTADSNNIGNITIGSESNNNYNNGNTHTSVYVDGDTVTNQLVHLSEAAQNYGTVINGYASHENKVREAAGNGDSINKYTVSDSTTDGVGTITLTKLPDLKLSTNFVEYDEVTPITSDLTSNYKLIVRMQKDRKTYYALADVTANGTNTTPIVFYEGTRDNNNGQIALGNTPYYFSGDEQLRTQVVIGANNLADALNKGTSEGVTRYNENTVGGDVYRDLTNQLYSSKPTVTLGTAQNTLNVTFRKQPNTGVAHKVKVQFYNTATRDESEQNKLNTLSPALGSNGETYYIVVELQNNGKTIGYKKFDVTSDMIYTANSTGTFELNIPDDEHFFLVDDDRVEIKENRQNVDTIRFDPSVYLSNVTLYQHVSGSTDTLLDARNNGSRTITGYDFGYNKNWAVLNGVPHATPELKTDSLTHTRLGLFSAYKKKYQVQVVFEDGMPSTVDGDYTFRTTVDHQTSGAERYVSRLNSGSINGNTISFLIEDQNTDDRNWTQYLDNYGNWSSERNSNTISGNETFTLEVGKGDPVNFSPMAEGMPLIINGKRYVASFEYHDMETGFNTESTVDDSDTKITTITDKIILKELEYERAKKSQDLIGTASEFGIVAGRYGFDTSHTETNFAVFDVQLPNVSIQGSGDDDVPFYAINANIGQWSETGVDLYFNTTNGQNVPGSISSSMPVYYDDGHVENKTGNVYINEMDADSIRSYVKDRMNEGKAASDALKSADKCVITPPAGTTQLDLHEFPEDAMIYINCEKLGSVLNGISIKKREGQTVVFNIPSTGRVQMGIVRFYFVDENGDPESVSVDGRVYSDIGTNDQKDKNADNAKNKAVDQLIMQHLVFNAYNASSVLVQDSAGLFLAPNATTVEERNSAGWLIGGEQTTVYNRGEMHFYFHNRTFSGVSTAYTAKKYIKKNGTNVAPTADQVFTFVMEELNRETGVWEYSASDIVHNAREKITFPTIAYTKASQQGVHYYRIRELNSPISNIESSDEQFIIKSTVSFDTEAANTPVHLKHSEKYYVIQHDKQTAEDLIKQESFNLWQVNASDDGTGAGKTDYTYYIINDAYLNPASSINGGTGIESIQFINRYVGAYCVAVTKAWDDEDDRDGVRPDGVILELWKEDYPLDDADGKPDTTQPKDWQQMTGVVSAEQSATDTPTKQDFVILTEANNWTAMVKGVDKYDVNGELIKYEWREKAFYFGTPTDAFSKNDEGNYVANGVTVINAKDNEGTFEYYVSENGSTYTATGTAGSTKVTYTGSVTGIDTKESAEDGGTITYITKLTNKHEKTTTEVEATKVWDDENNKYGLRKDIKLRLIGEYKVDEENENSEIVQVPYEVTNMNTNPKTVPMYSKTEGDNTTYLTKAEYEALEEKTGYSLLNSATVKWSNLPKYYDGHEITYKVVEELGDDMTGYTVTYNPADGKADANGKVTVTNTLAKGNLEVSKSVFVDNAEVKKPASGDDATYNALENQKYYFTVTTVIGEGAEAKTYYVVDNGDSAALKEAPTDNEKYHTVKTDGKVTMYDLPIGEYTVTEYVKGAGDVYQLVTNDNGQVNSWTFVSAISATTPKATVENGKTAEAKLINRYTSGKYCIAVTKQWLTNGEVRADDNLVLYVKLQRTTGDPNGTGANAPIWEDVKDIFLTSDGTTTTKASVITLNKANNWSADAVGMDQMDAAGARYSYRWVELASKNLNDVLLDQAVHGFNTSDNNEKHAVGGSNIVQQTVKDGKTLIFLTKLSNSNVEVKIPVRKLVNDPDDTLFKLNTEFTVTIGRAQNPTTAFPATETSTVAPASITLHKNDVGEFVVSNITMEGTYTYEIQETLPAAGTVPGLTNDSQKKIVEVKVRWHEDNTNDATLLDDRTYLEVEYIRWKNKNDTDWKYLVDNSGTSVSTVQTVDVVNTYELCDLNVKKTVTLDGEIVNSSSTSPLKEKTFYVAVYSQVTTGAGDSTTATKTYYATNGAVVSEEDRWVEIKANGIVTWSNLPAGIYYVEENTDEAAETGYDFSGVTFTENQSVTINTASKGTSAITVTATNAYTTLKTMAKVVKKWDDNGNQDGKRPTTVTMKLYANNVDTGISVKLADDENDQSFTPGDNTTYNTASCDVTEALTGIVYGLPAYVNGVEQSYTWIEDQSENSEVAKSGYTIKSIVPEPATYTTTGDNAVTYSGDMVTITNTHDASRYCLTVLKVWDDNNNATRPGSVTVELYSREKIVAEGTVTYGNLSGPVSFKTAVDGTAATSATLSADNNWTVMALGVDKYANGHELEYYWKETVPTP